MQIMRTVEIQCTPERLWSYLEEPEKLKRWLKGVVDVEPTSEGPTGVGSTSRMRIKEGGRIADYDLRFTAFEPPRRMAFTFSGGNLGDMGMNVEYRLTDLGGRTRLDYECTAEPKRWVMKVLSLVFRPFTAMQLNGFLANLKKLAEA